MAVAVIKYMASNFANLDNFEGADFRIWQKKMHFLLSSMSVVYVLTTPIPEDGDDNPTMEQVRKRVKWDNDDYGLAPVLAILVTKASQSRQHGKSESDSYYLSD
uniref:Zinc finger, CCHC-type n=1 Tax=Tanacetum cinerariifolium TaxID=118510 RepID=A0A6L2L0J1_TANCI|nr:zinc finger, CCHC-type [Tanacetum cinerariifolium]